MRALVLGGGGFIGRHVCDALTAAGHAVTVFDRVVTRFDLPHVVGQFQDRATLAAAVRGQDWVFHLVGTTLPKSSNDNPAFDVQSNLVGTLGVLDACVAGGVKRVVFASSGGVFNVGSGSGASLNDLIAALRSVTGEDFAVEHLPGRAVDVPRSVLDVRRAREVFGWRPRTPLAEGLARTWSWVQQVMDRDG